MVLHLDSRAALVIYEEVAIMFTSTNRLCAEHSDVPSVAVPGSYNQNCAQHENGSGALCRVNWPRV